jgi:hypothetical protein
MEVMRVLKRSLFQDQVASVEKMTLCSVQGNDVRNFVFYNQEALPWALDMREVENLESVLSRGRCWTGPDRALGQVTQESTQLAFYILQQAVSSLKWDFPAPMTPAVTWSVTWLSPLIRIPLSFSHLVIVQDWYVGWQGTAKQKESIYLKNLNQEYCMLRD